MRNPAELNSSDSPAGELYRNVIVDFQKKLELHPLRHRIEEGAVARQTVGRMLADFLWLIVPLPEYMAGLASRGPHYDHATKTLLIQEARNELDHTPLLVKTVCSLGIDGQAIFQGPEWSFRPSRPVWLLRQVLDSMVYVRPWVEGVAVVMLGLVGFVPILGVIFRAASKHYQLSGAELRWLEIHGAEMQFQPMMQQGLDFLASQIKNEDKESWSMCNQAVEMLLDTIATDYLDAYT